MLRLLQLLCLALAISFGVAAGVILTETPAAADQS